MTYQNGRIHELGTLGGDSSYAIAASSVLLYKLQRNYRTGVLGHRTRLL